MNRPLISLLTLLSVLLAAFISAPLAIAATDDLASSESTLPDTAPPAPPTPPDAPAEPTPPPPPAPASAPDASPAAAERPDTRPARIPPRVDPALTMVADDRNVVYGTTITLAGVLTPAAAGALTIEQWNGATWDTLAAGATDASGSWTHSFAPTGTMTIRARMDDDSATSSNVYLIVRPKLVITSIGRAPAYVGVRVRARVYPSTYGSKVSFSVRYAGRVRSTIRRRVNHGRINTVIPNPGIGRLPVSVRLPASGDLKKTTASFAVRGTVRALGNGSRGADVAALIRRLRELRFHTPASTTRYDARVGDAVLAFHKAHRMSRRSTVNLATWRAIAKARPMRPRYRLPARHIEVDKTRQILMVVRNGVVRGTLHVSTGATGNTPVGHWSIHQKGGSHLYRFMGFVGNFGIHGYVPVPAFPASHGCVREPMWAAAWTYSLTNYGDAVIIYR